MFDLIRVICKFYTSATINLDLTLTYHITAVARCSQIKLDVKKRLIAVVYISSRCH